MLSLFKILTKNKSELNPSQALVFSNLILNSGLVNEIKEFNFLKQKIKNILSFDMLGSKKYKVIK